MKKFFGEFKKFITRGNVIDMSVGVIVGGAFTSIVNGMSNFILKPIINWVLAALLGSNSLSEVYTYLKVSYTDVLDANGVATGEKVIDLTNSIYIDWGSFINAVINFVLIAFVLFIIVRSINKFADAQKRMNDIKTRIAFKQEKGLRLNKKERKFLAEEEKRLAEEAASARLAEEAAKNAPKVVTTEDLLTEIIDLLKNLADDAEIDETVKGNATLAKLFEKGLTLDDVKNFMENNEEGKQYLQSYGDKRVTDGIKTWKDKNLDTLINDAVLKATGKKKTPEELRFEELQKQLDDEKAIRIKAENTNKLNGLLSEAGLDPKKAAEFFNIDNMENIEKAIGNFKADMDEGIKAGVKEQIAAGNYTPPGENGAGELTADDLAKMMM